MFLSSKGQSTIEYVVVIALVISGIMIIGPYVIRSINAQFETIEDDTRQSFQEVPRQGPVISRSFPGCDCGTPVDSGGCGNGLNCPFTQRVFDRVCTPAGCELELLGRFGALPYECRNDLRCCVDTFLGHCGPNAIFVPGGCPDGQGEFQHECNVPPVFTYLCKPDPICIFSCIGNISTFAQWCDPVNFNRRLPSSLNIVHYDPGSCPADIHCAAQCFPTFIQDPPLPSPGIKCVCPPGMVPSAYGGCPAGTCYQGSCGPNQCEILP